MTISSEQNHSVPLSHCREEIFLNADLKLVEMDVEPETDARIPVSTLITQRWKDTPDVPYQCQKMDLLALPFILTKDLNKGIKPAIAFQGLLADFPRDGSCLIVCARPYLLLITDP